ncbi:carbohydrate esterase family 16 protein [Xylariaceae sp. FL0255]|nr:carbohydrate esterase family 16 protein [Xylariaceae sp. FL0255]
MYLSSTFLFAALVSAAAVPKPYFEWEDTKYFIAFGDSYTFVQGTKGLYNFSFIGDYLPEDFNFAPETLLTDKIAQNFTGTAEGGPNWVEFLTGCALEPGYTLPRDCKVQLWDFAFAGADVSEEFTALHHNFTIPLVNQTQQYLTWAEPVLSKIIDKSKSIVAIWIGINDIGDTSKFNVSFPAFYDEIIGTMFTESVAPLYKAGYNNFMFVNLPPLDRTPGNVASATPLPNKTMIDWWDASLEAHSKAFAAKNAGAKTMLYDANAFLNSVLDDPTAYNITNSTGYCASYSNLDVLYHPELYGCLPLDEYFWYNTGHMTSHTHKSLAPHMEAFLREQSTSA